MTINAMRHPSLSTQLWLLLTIQSVQLGSLRGDPTAFVPVVGVGEVNAFSEVDQDHGILFRPGADIDVTSLGYFDNDGLVYGHKVGIFDATRKVLLTSATVNSNGVLAEGFRFMTVRPVRLLAGHSYMLVGRELQDYGSGRDQSFTAAHHPTGEIARALVTHPLLTFDGYYSRPIGVGNSDSPLTLPEQRPTGPGQYAVFGPNILFRSITVPLLVSAGSVDGRTLGLAFDRDLDRPSAENVGNYVVDTGIAGIIIDGCKLRADQRSVELTLSKALPARIPYSVFAAGVVAKGIADPGDGRPANGIAAVWTLGLSASGIENPGDRISFTADNRSLELFKGGSAPWSRADSVAFDYRLLRGDFDLAALYLIRDADDSPAALGGLMVRESLEPRSRSASLQLDPGGKRGIWIIRQGDGGSAQAQASASFAPGYHWLRLSRRGQVLAGYYAPAIGTTPTAPSNWTRLDASDFSANPLEEALSVGFALGSKRSGEAVGIIIHSFEFRSLTLQMQPQRDRFEFSWSGPGELWESSSLGREERWLRSALPVRKTGDDHTVSFDFNTQPDPSRVPADRFFQVIGTEGTALGW